MPLTYLQGSITLNFKICFTFFNICKQASGMCQNHVNPLSFLIRYLKADSLVNIVQEAGMFITLR